MRVRPRVNRPLSIDRSTDAPFALQLFEMALQAQLGERPQKGGRVVVDVSNQRGSLSGLRRFQRLQRFLLSLQAMITQPKQGLSTAQGGRPCDGTIRRGSSAAKRSRL